MNVKVLKKQKEEVLNHIIKVYKNEINKLWEKIKQIDLSTNLSDPKTYIYERPNFILGEPQYDKTVLFGLVKRRLKRGNFIYKPFISNDTYFILIDWTNL